MKKISRADFVRQMTPGLELTLRDPGMGKVSKRTVLKANAGRVQFTTAKGTVTTLSFESGDEVYETDLGWVIKSGTLTLYYDRGYPTEEVPGSLVVHGNLGTIS